LLLYLLYLLYLRARQPPLASEAFSLYWLLFACFTGLYLLCSLYQEEACLLLYLLYLLYFLYLLCSLYQEEAHRAPAGRVRYLRLPSLLALLAMPALLQVGSCALYCLYCRRVKSVTAPLLQESAGCGFPQRTGEAPLALLLYWPFTAGERGPLLSSAERTGEAPLALLLGLLALLVLLAFYCGRACCGQRGQ
jgi:hypothetical protein